MQLMVYTLSPVRDIYHQHVGDTTHLGTLNLGASGDYPEHSASQQNSEIT
jgi:hypothetical protein